MFRFRHKLYPQPLVYTQGGPAVFSGHEFATDDEAIAAELSRNPEIEVLREAQEAPKKRVPRKKKGA